MKKNVICFGPLAQKKETDKQMASILYYKYQESVSQECILVLGKPGPKPLLYVNIGLFQYSGNELLNKQLWRRKGTLKLWQFLIDIRAL